MIIATLNKMFHQFSMQFVKKNPDSMCDFRYKELCEKESTPLWQTHTHCSKCRWTISVFDIKYRWEGSSFIIPLCGPDRNMIMHDGRSGHRHPGWRGNTQGSGGTGEQGELCHKSWDLSANRYLHKILVSRWNNKSPHLFKPALLSKY